MNEKVIEETVTPEQPSEEVKAPPEEPKKEPVPPDGTWEEFFQDIDYAQVLLERAGLNCPIHPGDELDCPVCSVIWEMSRQLESQLEVLKIYVQPKEENK